MPSPPKKPYTLTAPGDRCSVSMDWPLPDSSCKWNHVIRGLLRLASFTQHGFKFICIVSCVRTWFLFMAEYYSLNGYTTFCLPIPVGYSYSRWPINGEFGVPGATVGWRWGDQHRMRRKDHLHVGRCVQPEELSLWPYLFSKYLKAFQNFPGVQAWRIIAI